MGAGSAHDPVRGRRSFGRDDTLTTPGFWLLFDPARATAGLLFATAFALDLLFQASDGGIVD
jgi:hypothetical protein